MTGLARLLRPRSISIFGGKWAEEVIRQCRKCGYDGQIWPVHPIRDEIGGLLAYRSIEALPAAPDASFVAVNRDATIEVVAALAACGAGGAVCFASGFAETGDTARQQALVAAGGDMPFLGPNCYGFLNYLDNAHLWPDQHGRRRVERGVALISQSGNIAVNLTMQRRGLPMAYVVALGNQAKVGFSDLIEAMLDDPRVTAIGLVMEALDDAPAFARAASRARERRVPIVVLKLGTSADGAAAALSHTASLAGSDRAASAYLERLGVARARSLTGLVETLKLLHQFGPLPGAEIASMSCSGGEASLVADAAEGREVVRFRPFDEAQRAAVRATLGELVTVANPLDYHTFVWGDVVRLEAVYAAVLGASFDLVLLVIDWPRDDRCDTPAWEPCLTALAAAAARTGGRACLLATLPECLPERVVERAMAAGLGTLAGIGDTLDAIEAAAAIGAAWRRPRALPLALPPRPAGVMPLDEAWAKKLLSLAGIEVPLGRAAEGIEAATDTARAIGFPVALKLLGPAHKTEAGGVALDLADGGAVTRAAVAMTERSGAGAFLVERMVTAPVAELLVGVTRAEPYGLLLTIGAGGTLAELLADRVSLLLPVTPEEIEAALRSLRIFPLLEGYRGRPSADVGAVVAATLSLAVFALTRADQLAEVEINPLIATADGAVAADALLLLGKPP